MRSWRMHFVSTLGNNADTESSGLYRLFAMSTQPFDQWLLASAEKDPVMREAGLPNAMSRKLPRRDIQNQERVLS